MRLAAFFIAAFALTALPAAAQFASDQDRREALQYYRAGQELMSDEQFERAAEAFRLSIARDRLFTPSHYGLGQAYMALQRYASAVKAFNDCRDAHLALHAMAERGRLTLEQQRDDELRELKDTMRRLSQSGGSALRMRRLEHRIQDVERQRTATSEAFVPPPELSLSLGSAYFRTGDLEGAEREWKAAVNANPKFGEAYNNLAALYAMSGRKGEAEAALRAAEQARYRVNPQLKEDIRRMASN